MKLCIFFKFVYAQWFKEKEKIVGEKFIEIKLERLVREPDYEIKRLSKFLEIDLNMELLKKSDLDFEMLKPLITETANKIKNLSPSNAQTGPAKRNDLETIKKQINLLEDDDLKAIYNLITAQILNQK